MRAFGLAASICVGCAGVASGAAAQQPASDPGVADPAASRSTEFRAVTGPQQESVSGGGLLIAAYSIVWAAVFIYVIRLGRLQSTTAQAVTRLEGALKKASAGDKAKG